MEYRVFINDVEYGKSDIASCQIEFPLFDTLSVGNACSAEIEMEFWPKGIIPRNAVIVPKAKESEDDEWKTLGVFYLDERSESSGGKMRIVGFDAMLKAEEKWVPQNELAFPMQMSDTVRLIADMMGLNGIDERTAFETGENYRVDYPANDYTLRDALRFIAAAHMGNWIITEEEKLLLVPVFSIPDETSYLVTEDGDAIVFGGVRITV